MSSPRELLDQRGFVIMRGLLQPVLTSFLHEYLRTLIERGDAPLEGETAGAPQVPDAHSVYGAGAFETLGRLLEGPLSQTVNLDLVHSFNYARHYTVGDELPKHRDRGACEYSISLTLAHHPDTDWPLWVRSEGSDVPIHLGVGEGLFYRGCDITHWRDPLETGWLSQVFCFFVERDGPHADQAADNRRAARLGGPANVTT